MELYRRRMMMSAQGTPVPGVNYLISGSPTIVGNIMTLDGSSAKNFIYTKERFAPSSANWSIETKMRLHSWHRLADYITTVETGGAEMHGLVAQASPSGNYEKVYFYASSNGSTWNAVSGAHMITFDTLEQWTYVKIEKANNAIAVYKKVEGGNWATIGTRSYSYAGLNAYVAFGGGWESTCPNADFDLSETKIYIDGQLWWSAI